MRNLTDPTQTALYYNVLGAFNDLANKNTTLKNVSGKDIKWGDILYMYNLVINKDRFGSDKMTKIFETYAMNENSMPYKLSQYYSRYDSGLYDKNIDESLNNISVDDLLFNLYSENGILSLDKGKNILSLTDKNYTFKIDINKVEKVNYSISTEQKINKIMDYLKNNGFLLNIKCD